ncbi:MAG: AAA family ATPase [Lysobacterales bacterium]
MSSFQSPLKSLDTSLKALASQQGRIHIRQLRFPNYKNLSENSLLSFKFPITVLLGTNGTNKSSILHALYGSPARQTVADFWFETKLDAIPETSESGVKQSVAHSYLLDEEVVECIKARAPRGKDDPDYWEAIKPTTAYGFPHGAVRKPPVSLKVMHLDFRGELPAFDKYFYFPDQKHLAKRADYARGARNLRREYRKQDYLRRRAASLISRMDCDGVDLSEFELKVLRYLLERNYQSGKLLEHDLYHGHVGSTILFSTNDAEGRYSDAFAGSGESAATLLVHRLCNAPIGSLVLLDEPETSLHPRAQQRLIEFIAHCALERQLQVVMSTHSYFMADRLPQDAIRVLERSNRGKVQIFETLSAREALHAISSSQHGKVIFVEDDRAKHVILSALEKVSPLARKEIRVIVREGGTSRIFEDLRSEASSGQGERFFVLDGDHRNTFPAPAAGEIPGGRKELERLISELTKGPNRRGPAIKFSSTEEMKRYVNFFRDNVRFLPGSTPEELVWDKDCAVQLLQIEQLPDEIVEEDDAKRRLELAAECTPGIDADTLFRMLVANYLRSTCCRELLETLNYIRQA